MNIGTTLRNLIEQEGITQRELAEALNISTSTLNGYIQNRRKPDAKTVILLASYFNTTTDYLYGCSNAREPFASPYHGDERHLVNIYRNIPDYMKALYIETGEAFLRAAKKELGKDQGTEKGQSYIEPDEDE